MKEKIKNEVMKFGGEPLATPQRIIRVAQFIKEKVENGNKIVVVVSAMGDETRKLMQLAQKIYGGVPPSRELDKLFITGEMRSASFLAIALKSLGINAVSLTGSQIMLETDTNYGKAKIKRIHKIDRIVESLAQNKVVIVSGFQGVIEGTDEPVTLGRGGSDLTLVALTIALGAKYCEKFTKIDGVFAIDPQVIPEAKRFEKISHSQMLQLASAGASVLMDRCVWLAQAFGVDIWVGLSPSLGKTTGGTLVCSGGTLRNMEGFISPQSGVAIKEGSLVTVSNIPNRPGAAAEVFRALSDINIIDCAQGQGGENANISILCKAEDLEQVLLRLNKVEKARTIGKGVDVVVLTLINSAMKEETGWLYRVANAIAQEGVNIEMLSTVGETILIVVKKEKLKQSAMALAKEFDLLS